MVYFPYNWNAYTDVITQLEPELFRRVTGLNVKDFELLCSLGVFNSSLMNDAVYKFKRYEDSSLEYTGINKHTEDKVGGWDSVIKKDEYERLFYNQQSTLEQPAADHFLDIEEAEEDLWDMDIYKENEPEELEDSEAGEIKDEIGLPSVNLGSAVVHKRFGEGTVIKLTENKITVRFAAGEKLFGFPDAFVNGFLHAN